MPEKDLQPYVAGWNVIETALREAGLTGPPGNPDSPFSDRAEEVSKAVTSRLAFNDPPILLCFAHELEEPR